MQIQNNNSKIAEIKRAERALKHRSNLQNMQQIDQVAQEFEAVFLSQMLQHMFADVNFNPMGEEKATNDIYKSLLVDEYGKLMSRTGGIGIADHVKQEMLKLQEVDHGK